jgi:hypothetical protein
MKVKNFLYLALIGSLTLSACKKDPEPEPEPLKGTLQVNFTGVYNGTPLVINNIYNSAAFGYRIKPETLKYLLHHLYAKNDAGTEYEIKEAMTVDFQNASNSFTVQMDPGNYTGIKFNLGVDSTLNHADPTVLPIEHPFSVYNANDMHWGWSTGYIFLKFEGRSDTTGNGSGSMNNLFFFHAGNDSNYEELPYFNAPFTIIANQTTQLTVQLDVDKLLVGTSDTIDVKTDNATHTNDNPFLARRIVQLWMTAFSVF